ncbi:hypothetical protein H920_14001 [Fukomys damarensis]|uniref:Uncharacterized protein n=1 Tax=Fukomys damarensis TaxID=885580 RepID=A0A091D2T8_FUKDA|nr:hypothetical protein H920_14001 [Fukomys damarensis]
MRCAKRPPARHAEGKLRPPSPLSTPRKRRQRPGQGTAAWRRRCMRIPEPPGPGLLRFARIVRRDPLRPREYGMQMCEKLLPKMQSGQKVKACNFDSLDNSVLQFLI